MTDGIFGDATRFYPAAVASGAEDAISVELPAVLVGGPPHSGKSVLIYSLSQALRQRRVEHYALRACPDGEGDWSNEAPPALVRQIRLKGQWTSQWLQRVSRDIRRRHLPLLVDVGGRPTPEQAAMFGLCTHAVLLTPDAAARAWWTELVQRHGLPIVADLTSDLHGENRLDSAAPVVRGVLAGLERHHTATGPAFDALVERLAALLACDGAALRRSHLAAAPEAFELVIDLERLAHTLGVPQQGERSVWAPQHLPALLDYLPAGQPLAIYGRAPVWVYAALARLAWPSRFANWDVRLGWVEPQPLPTAVEPPAGPVQWTVQAAGDAARLSATLPEHYLDITQLPAVTAPRLPEGVGVSLSGKLPNWLFASLAQTYAAAPWLAVYQPQPGADIVVHSTDGRRLAGAVLEPATDRLPAAVPLRPGP